MKYGVSWRSREVVNRARSPEPPEIDKHEAATDDTRQAFRDYGIPDDLVDDAVSAGELAGKDAGDIENFVLKILDTKRSLDDLVSTEGSERRSGWY